MSSAAAPVTAAPSIDASLVDTLLPFFQTLFPSLAPAANNSTNSNAGSAVGPLDLPPNASLLNSTNSSGLVSGEVPPSNTTLTPTLAADLGSELWLKGPSTVRNSTSLLGSSQPSAAAPALSPTNTTVVIVASVVGSVLFIALTAMLCILFRRRRRRNNDAILAELRSDLEYGNGGNRNTIPSFSIPANITPPSIATHPSTDKQSDRWIVADGKDGWIVAPPPITIYATQIQKGESMGSSTVTSPPTTASSDGDRTLTARSTKTPSYYRTPLVGGHMIATKDEEDADDGGRDVDVVTPIGTVYHTARSRAPRPTTSSHRLPSSALITTHASRLAQDEGHTPPLPLSVIPTITRLAAEDNDADSTHHHPPSLTLPPTHIPGLERDEYADRRLFRESLFNHQGSTGRFDADAAQAKISDEIRMLSASPVATSKSNDSKRSKCSADTFGVTPEANAQASSGSDTGCGLRVDTGSAGDVDEDPLPSPIFVINQRGGISNPGSPRRWIK